MPGVRLECRAALAQWTGPPGICALSRRGRLVGQVGMIAEAPAGTQPSRAGHAPSPSPWAMAARCRAPRAFLTVGKRCAPWGAEGSPCAARMRSALEKPTLELRIPITEASALASRGSDWYIPKRTTAVPHNGTRGQMNRLVFCETDSGVNVVKRASAFQERSLRNRFQFVRACCCPTAVDALLTT